MSGMYAKAKEKLWTANLNITGTVRAIGVNSSLYIVNLSTHEFYSDITAGIVTTAVTLTSVTYASGKFTAASITLPTPTDRCDAVVIYISTGVPGTSPLICYLDDSTGLPSLPAAGAIPIDWDSTLGIVSL